MEELQTELVLPVICTRGMIVFPNNDLTLDVGRPKSLKAIEDAANIYDGNLVFVSQKDPASEDPDFDGLFQVGTLCKIKKKIRRDSAGTIKLTVSGVDRVRLDSLDLVNGCLYAQISPLQDVFSDQTEEVALVRNVAKNMENFMASVPSIPHDVRNALSKGVSSSRLADTLANYLPLSLEKKQRLLETLDVNERLMLLISEIEEEKVINDIEQNINKKVRQSIDENQREFYLREKLRAIKEELGDTPSKDDDTDTLRERIEKNPYPKHVKEKALDELKRYEMMPPASSEANVVRGYLDWLLDTPWYQETTDNEDLQVVEDRLNEDHYGLEKPKERILEYLAVKQMTHSLKSPILCLVGPPGVGKTSLAKSVARALDRKFVKASLGGVKDESEIRGHRRTYLGSMPGRIIQSMKKAGVINPVFLLDELDKMSSDYRGDPASAMLEVLDPEQNSFFSDNYLEEAYDLSHVLFIATANSLDGIPAPLLDRLEIIELSSYTEQEKLVIAREHLYPKKLAEHGLTAEQMTVTDEAIMYMIRHHTREAGVRQLERLMAQLARKAVVKVLKEKLPAVHIDVADLEEYLGKDRYEYTQKLEEPQIGVVTGMAYTQYGGDILPIEVNHFEGSGKCIITGQLGDVMKESASIALDYVKSNANRFGLKTEDFEKQDVHIHVPEGAIKKDGPSAGVTLTTAIYSAFTNRPVRSDIAMTGEITLRGKVLPIGGLKEKSISAHRSGIRTIIIPKENEKDIEDIPEQVRQDLTIVLASHIDTVLDNAIVKE